MNTNQVTVTGMNRVTRPKPNKGGSMVLGYFDCEANGIAINGMAFVRTSRNGLTVWPPKLEGPESARRSIVIACEPLRSVMVRQAQAAYRAMGGTDGEWIPYDSDESSE